MCRGGGTPRSSGVFIDTGARLSEVTNLKMSDVDLDDQTLWVRRASACSRSVRRLSMRSTAISACAGRTYPASWIGGKGGMTPSGIAQCSGVARPAPGSATSTRTSFVTRSLASGSPPKVPRGGVGDCRVALEGHAQTVRRRALEPSPGRLLGDGVGMLRNLPLSACHVVGSRSPYRVSPACPLGAPCGGGDGA
jgi:hypothetical protein